MKTFSQNKKGNVIASLLKASAAISTCVFFVACGGDSSSSEPSGEASQEESSSSSETPSIPSYESENDLPNCSKNREGEIVEVKDERKAYICEDGRWEFDHVILDSVKTEDDLSACLAKNEGDSVWVKEESAVFVCIDRKWEKQETEEDPENASIPTYESEDELPNCSKDRKGNLALVEDEAMLCNDGKWRDLGTAYETSDSVPNCTKKREGKTAFILDEYLALVCNDGKWKEDDEVEEIVVKPEAKSSSSGKSGGKSSSSDKEEASSSSSGKKNASSSSAKSNVKTESFKDSRDGKTYKTVKIGDQVWFAENLNYDDGKGLCPLKNAKNCEKYGRLYNFEEPGVDDSPNSGSNVASLCPEGWHIPDTLDWAKLISYVSANNDGEPVGVSLKATTGWVSEGDSMFIEANENSIISRDSTRIGATRGTDRFGFRALPAGSCWDDGGCYADDDTRFYFVSGLGSGSFKLAFDKDDFMYSEDGPYGWISVRCLQNPVIEIDSIPPVNVVDTLVWMAEDLTHNGSAEFALRDAFYACPAGWRLPTESELKAAVDSGKFTVPTTAGSVEYFLPDNHFRGTSITCYDYGHCTVTLTADKPERHVRCVSQDIHIVASGCTCSASEPDSANKSVTWSVSGCKEGSGKISGYSWDFGSDSAGVEVSGTKATKTFDSFAIVTPSVSVNSSVAVDGKDYAFAQKMTCPTVRAGLSESAIRFKSGLNEMTMLYEGTTYTAILDDGCSDTGYQELQCNSNGTPISVTIAGKTYSSKSDYYFSAKLNRDSVCNGEFTLSVSTDIKCTIYYW